MNLTFIAALSENNVIGHNGETPWYISDDLKHFKERTKGNVVIVGRKTQDAIVRQLGKPLPGRRTVVVTGNRKLKDEPGKVLYVHSLENALQLAEQYAPHDAKAYVIGGATLYHELLAPAERLELTRVHQSFEGDTYFPTIDFTQWKEVSREEYRDAKIPFSFIDYERAPHENP